MSALDGTDLDGEDLGRAAARGGVWSVAGEISSRAAQSIVFFVLAGFLSPAEFGAAAVAFVCVQVANALTYAGLGQAVQVLGRDTRRDRSAVGMGLVMGFAGAALLALLAEPLCDLLSVPSAVNLVRLVGLTLPLAQTSEVLSALLARDLHFRTTGTAVVVGSVVSAVAGLGLAAAGVGATALVAQGVVQPGIRLVWLVVARPGNFRPALHRREVRELWGTGRELLLGSVFETAAGNIDNVVVSVQSGAASLGAYGFAYNLTALPMFVVGRAVGRVALPVYTRLRDRAAAMGPSFTQAVEVTTYLTALPLGYLAVAGPEALNVLFGDKWDPIATTLRLLALHGWLRATETASTAVLVALGRAATTRRVQQWQFLLAAALLVPLVHWQGPLGAAAAISIAVTVGTAYSLWMSTVGTGARPAAVLHRMVLGALTGCAGGEAGLLVLRTVDGASGLVLSLVAAVVCWLLLFWLLRRETVTLGFRLLRPGRAA